MEYLEGPVFFTSPLMPAVNLPVDMAPCVSSYPRASPDARSHVFLLDRKGTAGSRERNTRSRMISSLVLLRAIGPHRGVRSRLQLGQREASDAVAPRKRSKKFLLRFFGAEMMNRSAVQGTLSDIARLGNML